MNEWESMLKLGYKEVNELPIGTTVQLNFCQKPIGKIIEIQEPIGLLAPRFKCRWDDGDESGWLLKSDLTILQEKTS